MLINIFKYFAQKIRKEKFEIGNFSNKDILRISFSRFLNLIRGITFLLFHFKKPKFFFFVFTISAESPESVGVGVGWLSR